MALTISGSETAQTKSQELLDAYLKGACRNLSNSGRLNADAKFFIKQDSAEFNSFYGKPATKDLLTGIAPEDIVKKETELMTQVKGASFKEKANYALNMESHRKGDMSAFFWTYLAAAPGLGILTSAGEQGYMTGAVIGAAVAGLAIGGVKAAYKIKDKLQAKNQSEQDKIDNYYNAKHALVALKQLKNAMKAEMKSSYKEQVGRLFAAGYGQPSGGLIQAAKLKNQGR